jgi:hypothetical protein
MTFASFYYKLLYEFIFAHKLFSSLEIFRINMFIEYLILVILLEI